MDQIARTLDENVGGVARKAYSTCGLAFKTSLGGGEAGGGNGEEGGGLHDVLDCLIDWLGLG